MTPRESVTGELSDPVGKRKRVADLEERIVRLRAELSAVEDGTMGYVEEVRKGITADGLAHIAAISPQAANNRLRRLQRAGILVRDAKAIPGGGRLYTYDLTRVPS